MHFFDVICLAGIAFVVIAFLAAWINLKLYDPARLKTRRDIPRLIRGLSVTAIEKLVAYIDALGEVGDVRAIAPLAARMKHSDAKVRQAAEFALKHLTSRLENHVHSSLPSAEPEIGELISLLQNPNSIVARAAAVGLTAGGWQPGSNDRAWWSAACQDWDACLRQGEQSIEPLTFGLRNWYKEHKEIQDAVSTIAQIGGNRAMAFIVHTIQNPYDDIPLFKAVQSALMNYSEQLVEPLIHHFSFNGEAGSRLPLDIVLELLELEMKKANSVLPIMETIRSNSKHFLISGAKYFFDNLEDYRQTWRWIISLQSPVATERKQALLQLQKTPPRFTPSVLEIFLALLKDPAERVYTWTPIRPAMRGGDGRESDDNEMEYTKVEYPIRMLSRDILSNHVPHFTSEPKRTLVENALQQAVFSHTPTLGWHDKPYWKLQWDATETAMT